MELKQLEAYVKVYELQSFSRAAEEMFLSQPTMSLYVSLLEQELRSQLIHRSTKELLPTKTGELFYEYAKEILLLRDKSIAALKSMSDCSTGSIDILASSVPAQYILPQMLGAFHKLYPSLVFNVTQADTAEVVRGISAHKGEIGFVGAKIENPKCVYTDFMSESLILIAPYERRFEVINPDEAVDLLRKEYFVMREDGSGTKLEYEECLKNIGIEARELNIRACFSNTQSIIHAVANGLGLSIVSELAARYYIKHKMVVPICINLMSDRHFYIVQKKNSVAPVAVDMLIKFACAYDISHTPSIL